MEPQGPGGASEAQERAGRLRVPLQGEGQGVSRGLQGSCPRPAPAPLSQESPSGARTDVHIRAGPSFARQGHPHFASLSKKINTKSRLRS